MIEAKKVDHAEFKETLITEEALAKYRARIGTKLRVHTIIDEVHRLSLRLATAGVGDPNPLWTDPEYARKTRYGKNPAPPYFFYKVNPGWVQHGLPGVHAFHSGSDWTIYKPALIGDTVTPEITFTGYEEKKSGFSGKFIMEYQEGKYFNQRKELLASVKGWLVRAERSAAREKGKYSGIQLPHPWTEAELKKVDDDVLAEQVRGAQVRYWEDVKVGEELQPVVKGPLGLTDEIAYEATSGREAHILSLRNYREHPSWAFRDPDTYAWEPIAAVHWNIHAARAAGLPYPYDIGAQRQCWLMNFLSHWMGDEGWLKKNYAEYRKFVYFSDVVWFKGKVTKKYVDEDGDYVVDVETHGWNQRNEDTIPGHSIICLPSREHKYWPLERRLK